MGYDSDNNGYQNPWNGMDLANDGVGGPESPPRRDPWLFLALVGGEQRSGREEEPLLLILVEMDLQCL